VEGRLAYVENPNPAGEATETFAQALTALKDTYHMSDSEIARRLSAHGVQVSVQAVNTWVHGKRIPRSATIRALAELFPKFPAERLLAAAGRRAPAPLSPDGREEALAILDRMTEEQRKMWLIAARAVADSND
jgi:transcriptional regulator with XRE-family HTH domain